MRAVLTLAALAGALAAAPLRFRLRDAAAARARDAAAARHGAPPPDLFFAQRLDHLSLDEATEGESLWLQRYWVNATLFEAGGRKGPVFLYLEGEGTGSPYSVLEGEHVELAVTHGALIISLEHRFYGASIPTRDLTTSNLRYLSSDQAIGDIARFVTMLVPTLGVNLSASKVVTFGGSYPGALSAWTRLRLPHLVSIAVSTSSPVEASYDFTAYNEVVGASLATELVGGSAACAAAVRESFTALDAALAAGGAPAKAASAALNSCQDLSAASPLDVMWGASNAAGVFQGLVQYNDEGGSLDIRAVCQIMANASATPIERLATAVRAASGPSCIDNNYSDYVVTAGNTTADKAARGLGLRQWMWQSCSQFAYWQTCEDRAVCPLSLYMTLESNTRQCADLFGAAFTAAVSEERVKNTNALYGGDRIASTRTIFVNGRIDPWHALSVLDTRPSTLAIFIDGTAHCRQMQPSRETDSPALKAARAEVAAQLVVWL